MTKNRVAITGIGIFCAAGKDVPAFTENLFAGRSAIGPVDIFDVSRFPARIGAQVRDYDPLEFFDARSVKRLSRADQFGLIAAGEALHGSRVRDSYSPYDIGVSMGAGASGMYHAELWLSRTLAGLRAHPSLLRGILPDRTATDIALRYDLAGYQGSIMTACSSSATAIGWGATWLPPADSRRSSAGAPTPSLFLPMPGSIRCGLSTRIRAPPSAATAAAFRWGKGRLFSFLRTKMPPGTGGRQFMAMSWVMPWQEKPTT